MTHWIIGSVGYSGVLICIILLLIVALKRKKLEVFRIIFIFLIIMGGLVTYHESNNGVRNEVRSVVERFAMEVSLNGFADKETTQKFYQQMEQVGIPIENILSIDTPKRKLDRGDIMTVKISLLQPQPTIFSKITNKEIVYKAKRVTDSIR